MSLKEVREPFSSNSRGLIHEEKRLQIEELDEWQTHKLRTHDKPKLRQNKLNTSPNQLKVGDKVSLDATDPHIDTDKLNEEIRLTVLSIFPFGTVKAFEITHGQEHGRAKDCVETGQRFSPARAMINHHSRATCYKELQSSLLLGDSKLHWGRFSMTAMSCSTTNITNFKYNILLVQDLWTNEPLPPPEYPPPPSRRLFSKS
ncbi:hypothetical protein GOBAR_AA22559 [Gossypium barbadense]|uniref:Uncharacterized protein n=1 Tax=Gossypium barbadense TaxID=3634 RepID=A0A2P5X457_GOSBA|nr:hypothetical protein GOBAR_AA22559 [Gossypium barbadense]